MDRSLQSQLHGKGQFTQAPVALDLLRRSRLTAALLIRTYLDHNTYVLAREMTTKLTLSVDESIAELAKRAAKSRNTSVSAMLSRFVTGLEAMDKPEAHPPIGPLTLAATGLARRPSDQDASPEPSAVTDAQADQALLEDALWERYGPVE